MVQYTSDGTHLRENVSLPPSLSLIIGHVIFMGLGAMTLMAVANLVGTNSCIVPSSSFLSSVSPLMLTAGLY